MAYTEEELLGIKELVTFGCTAKFKYVGFHTYDLSNYSIVVNDDKTFCFVHAGGNNRWHFFDCIKLNGITWEVFDFKWPDGSPMIPFVEYNGKPYNPITAKIASLEARFKSKSLPKTKMQPLPLGA